MTNEGFKTPANNSAKPAAGSGKTIDLQGVASFAQLVELLAQELGTAPGRMQGMLPSGPASFDELVGEIVVNSQGFERNLVLSSRPGAPLKIRFQSMWRSNEGDNNVTGVESHYFLDATVEQVVPQGRALARYIEDTFTIMDRMVQLGQGGKLNGASISNSEIAAFENSEAETLVRMRDSATKASESFIPNNR